jgi:uncharacterized protein YfaS (alpha-2-macroglobulin family)
MDLRLARWLGALALLLGAGAAQALAVKSVSPQGENPQARQVVLRFDGDATAFGDAQAKPAASIRCSDPASARGTGRWTSSREWVYDFEQNMPPGQRCIITLTQEYAEKIVDGPRGTSTTSYQFHTGGPTISRLWPDEGEAIEETQAFVLELSGTADLASVRQHVTCRAEGVGERIAVRLIEGAERDALLRTLDLTDAARKAPARYLTFTCARRLPGGVPFKLIWGKGVATPSGVTSSVGRELDYRVRDPFKAEMNCERENAKAGCLPIKPIRLSFNAEVAPEQLQAIRLVGGGQSLAPQEPRADDEPSQGAAVSFGPVGLKPSTTYQLVLPPGLKDATDRPLTNARSFPLTLGTGPLPPLLKFSAAPFGIVERYAEGRTGPALLPVTVRSVEAQLGGERLAVGDAKVQLKSTRGDEEIVRWLDRVQRYHESVISRGDAAAELRGPLPRPIDTESRRDMVETRSVSLLAGESGLQSWNLPASSDPKAPRRPFEVIGIPLPPGFHVVEIASQLLGQSLLDEGYGPKRPMFVRTAVLVTNIALHVKLARDGSALAWVTTLDNGKPVAGARVSVGTCQGKEIASATTDAEGLARFAGLAEPTSCHAHFVSARAGDDLAFTRTDWQRGIDPWRFNLPVTQGQATDQRIHTILDRTLLRAGETVSMKHIARAETSRGFGPAENLPARMIVTHQGSGQRYEQALAWRKTATGGQSAESEFKIPPAAKLGAYTIELAAAGRGYPSLTASGQFRVEEFRLPVFEGRVEPVQKDRLVAPRTVPARVQLAYLSGGPAARLPVKVSALLRPRVLAYDDYPGFVFTAPRKRADGPGASREADSSEADAQPVEGQARVVLDKLPLTLDASGAAPFEVKPLPPMPTPHTLTLEASFSDPNGEVQSLRQQRDIWPADVVAGVSTAGWVSLKDKARIEALALEPGGKPAPGTALTIRGRGITVNTTRKRLVGGFYSYDNRVEVKDLGTLCTGKADARGVLACEAALPQLGEVELVVTATDAAGRSTQAATSIWVTGDDEMWFGGDDHDRLDLLPEKRAYAPGEEARFQVRMPFRHATALVTLEREGVTSHRVMQLHGKDPSFTLKVDGAWAPNLYVSVLVLRGRVFDVPWYSFFTWGWRQPGEWWSAYRRGDQDQPPPTAMVDLAKPAFRLGVAEIRVGHAAHQMQVKVQTDKETYPVRGQTLVTVSATLPDGKPAAGGEVALAAVDQALLELSPNRSWDLLDAMMQRRGWGVLTATAMNDIIGRRHYGRKAVPAGGGGGRGATRELFDTLLLWNPRVQLDASGQAQVKVPLNDSLTAFRIAAIADAGLGAFGSGGATIRSTQDLQIISALPPLVREDDRFRAAFTLRNTTAKPMKVKFRPRATMLQLSEQSVDVPAGEAREVTFDVVAPAALAFTRNEAILWEVEARDETSGATDALKVRQRIEPRVPLTVRQASLTQVDGSLTLDVQTPPRALPGRGGLRLSLQPKLATGLTGVRDWFASYPYACLEQKTSKAVGLRDGTAWQAVIAQLPTYLDANGLAMYYPAQPGMQAQGSDTLTAYLLAATHEAAALNAAFMLPDDAVTRMQGGLVAFIEGKVTREHWSPRPDLQVRKLAAIEALSRYGKAHARLLGSIDIAPAQWPTHALIDWLNILRRVDGVPDRQARLAEASQMLRARLSVQGTRIQFANEQNDYWWWLMQNGDANAARLILAVLDDPDWRDELPRLVNGFMGRQDRGAWLTTTANLWGGLALEKFSQAFERDPVTGKTVAELAGKKAEVDWSRVETVKTPLPDGMVSLGFGAPPRTGDLVHNTMTLAWPAAKAPLAVTQQGGGKPWLTMQAIAAVEALAPVDSGYRVRKTLTPVQQARPGVHTRGDVLRITLDVDASTPMTWVVLSDPIPGGATILGSGLGRDSMPLAGVDLAPSQARFVERLFSAYRAYYAYLPKGSFKVEYLVRLNNAGEFGLPPTRVEAMYAPEVFGEAPNARLSVVQP